MKMEQLLYWGHDGKNWIIFLWEAHLYVEGHREIVDLMVWMISEKNTQTLKRREAKF